MVAIEQSVRDAATAYSIARVEWEAHLQICLACYACGQAGQRCYAEQRLARLANEARETWVAVMGRSESLPQSGPARRRAGAGTTHEEATTRV